MCSGSRPEPLRAIRGKPLLAHMSAPDRALHQSRDFSALERASPHVANSGVGRRQVHEARQIRDAEAEPGIVRCILNAKLAASNLLHLAKTDCYY